MRTANRALLLALLLPSCIALGVRAPAGASTSDDDTPGARSFEFAVSPDGQAAFAPGADRHALRKIRLTDGLVLARHRFEDRIGAVALSNDGGTVAVAFPETNHVTLVDSERLEPVADVPTGSGPRILEFGSEGTDLCVLCPKDSELDVIDYRAGRLLQIVPLPSTPSCSAHAGDHVGITLPDTGEVLVLDHPGHRFLTSLYLSPVPDWIAAGGCMDSHLAGHAGHTTNLYGPISSQSQYNAYMQSQQGSQAAPGSGMFVVVSSEGNTVTLLGSESLTVLGTTRVNRPRIAAAGCCASPWAFVLTGNGDRVAGIPIDPADPRFGTVSLTWKLREPAESMRVGSDGVCWALSVSRNRLYAIDPRHPDGVRSIAVSRHVK